MTTPVSPAAILHDLCLSAAQQIADECRYSVYASHISTEAVAVDAPVVALLGRQADRILAGENCGSTADPVLHRLTDIARLAHARFYAHRPDAVPACWRQLYTDASLLQTVRRWQQLQQQRTDPVVHPSLDNTDVLDGLVHPLDRALILAGGAGPAGRGSPWIHAALEALHALWAAGADAVDNDWSACPPFDDGLPAAATPTAFVPPVRHPVPRTGPLGLAAFQAYLDGAVRDGGGGEGDGPQPLVLAGLLDDWPARRVKSADDADDGEPAHPWAVPAYLRWRTLGGRRLVPVEAGRSYVDAGWTQALVPFEVVLRELEGCRDDDDDDDDDGGLPRPLYLAQHGLLTQMPALRRDIRVPDACYTTPGGTDDDDDDDDNDNDEPTVNAWLGPAGTITPLHTDPHHNLLAQVVGHKYVRLYAPRHGPALRPATTTAAAAVDMSNTSGVDVGVLEGWDEGEEDEDDDHAHVSSLPYLDCLLAPGDTLYIPRGWWHYVRSVSVSCSVSFWWD